MSTFLKPIVVSGELLKQNIRIFTPQMFSFAYNSSRVSTKYFLETQTKNNLFGRLKKGLYFLKANPPSEEEIANALYRPSYLSFEYALAYHGVLPEMVYTITSATTKSTRLFEVENSNYSYRTIKKEAFTGYTLIKKSNRSFLMADLEKALVDYAYFVVLKKTPVNDRLFDLIKGKTNIDKINKYSKLYKNRLLENLLKTII
ncbi:hypothetical protein A2188_01495 [Candidatus Woesebacteria bacterium RIFOXYA1_FULL_43_9]|uniref:AbiEi antitoxin C-terminal domain-containing protein n=1 Tax=Candidatus Woesebacteria bacterium RIFOXYA1_FULL_43_9 TaxID=1802534 RepID=A0A1F8CLP5_9BACT|nr:MAG: hypothetical protein A2188_01495 [Candidatus Woesebacteria bacterium RIFOXYA1_FULL_43_9]